MNSMAMKQSSTHRLPPQIASATKDPVTEAERRKVLSVGLKSGIFGSAVKREFFTKTLTYKHDIISHGDMLDQCGSTTNLSSLLDSILPQSVYQCSSRGWKVPELTDRFMSFHPPFETMLGHMREQLRILESLSHKPT